MNEVKPSKKRSITILEKEEEEKKRQAYVQELEDMFVEEYEYESEEEEEEEELAPHEKRKFSDQITLKTNYVTYTQIKLLMQKIDTETTIIRRGLSDIEVKDFKQLKSAMTSARLLKLIFEDNWKLVNNPLIKYYSMYWDQFLQSFSLSEYDITPEWIETYGGTFRTFRPGSIRNHKYFIDNPDKTTVDFIRDVLLQDASRYITQEELFSHDKSVCNSYLILLTLYLYYLREDIKGALYSINEKYHDKSYDAIMQVFEIARNKEMKMSDKITKILSIEVNYVRVSKKTGEIREKMTFKIMNQISVKQSESLWRSILCALELHHKDNINKSDFRTMFGTLAQNALNAWDKDGKKIFLLTYKSLEERSTKSMMISFIDKFKSKYYNLQGDRDLKFIESIGELNDTYYSPLANASINFAILVLRLYPILPSDITMINAFSPNVNQVVKEELQKVQEEVKQEEIKVEQEQIKIEQQQEEMKIEPGELPINPEPMLDKLVMVDVVNSPFNYYNELFVNAKIGVKQLKSVHIVSIFSTKPNFINVHVETISKANQNEKIIHVEKKVKTEANKLEFDIDKEIVQDIVADFYVRRHEDSVDDNDVHLILFMCLKLLTPQKQTIFQLVELNLSLPVLKRKILYFHQVTELLNSHNLPVFKRYVTADEDRTLLSQYKKVLALKGDKRQSNLFNDVSPALILNVSSSSMPEHVQIFEFEFDNSIFIEGMKIDATYIAHTNFKAGFDFYILYLVKMETNENNMEVVILHYDQPVYQTQNKPILYKYAEYSITFDSGIAYNKNLEIRDLNVIFLDSRIFYLQFISDQKTYHTPFYRLKGNFKIPEQLELTIASKPNAASSLPSDFLSNHKVVLPHVFDVFQRLITTFDFYLLFQCSNSSISDLKFNYIFYRNNTETKKTQLLFLKIWEQSINGNIVTLPLTNINDIEYISTTNHNIPENENVLALMKISGSLKKIMFTTDGANLVKNGEGIDLIQFSNKFKNSLMLNASSNVKTKLPKSAKPCVYCHEYTSTCEQTTGKFYCDSFCQDMDYFTTKLVIIPKL
jgi:hypothetical protein